MEEILISIKPKYVAKILNGEKTIEIRKTMPKCDFPIEVYIYCTKEKDLFKSYIRMGYYTNRSNADDIEYNGKGKVVAKFTLNKVEEIKVVGSTCANFKTKSLEENELLQLSCLGYHELFNYFQPSRDYEGYESKVGYAWHIDNLVIFDKPKELSEFVVVRPIKPLYSLTDIDKKEPISFKGVKPLVKAPQSWCYVEKLL